MPDSHEERSSDTASQSATPAQEAQSKASDSPAAKPRRDTRLRNRLFWLLLAAALITGFWLA